MDPTPESTIPPADSANPIYRTVRLIVITVFGFGTILVGIALLVLPGPGLLVIFSGIGILAVEYAWAHHLFRRIRIQAKKIWKWLWTKRNQKPENRQQAIVIVSHEEHVEIVVTKHDQTQHLEKKTGSPSTFD